MNETITPPTPFDAVPVGGPAAVLDYPRPAPPPPRPAPRQTIPLLPIPEPPKPPARLPAAVAPETPPAPPQSPLAGSPPPKPTVFTGLLWDLVRPNRAKAAVIAGVTSLAVGAFGLNMLFPNFGTAMPAEQTKIKIPVEEPPKPLAAAPTSPTVSERDASKPAPAPAPAPEPKPPAPRVGEVGRDQSKPGEVVIPSVPGGLPPQPGALPVKPEEMRSQPIVDPNLKRTGSTTETPPPAPVTPPPTPVLTEPGATPKTPLPTPSDLGGTLPAIPTGPMIPDLGGGPKPPELKPPQPGVAAPPNGVAPKPPEMTPASPALPPGGGALKTVETPPAPPAAGLPPLLPAGSGAAATEPIKTPDLPPVDRNRFDDKKPPEVKTPDLPAVDMNRFGDKKPADVTPPLPALPTAPLGGDAGTTPAAPGVLPLPGLPTLDAAKPPPLPTPTPTPTLSEVKPTPTPPPLEVKPLPPVAPPPAPREPIVGAGGTAPAPAPTPPVVGLPTATPPTPVIEAKTEYDVDLYRPHGGDTYATVSKAYYGGAEFAGALQAFNRNQPIERIGEVQVPPVHVIRKFANPRGGDPTPDRFTPTRPAATDDGPEWGAPGAALGGQTVYTLFKVPRAGMTLKDVAKVFFDSERSWAKLNNSRNPKFDPDEELPVGTQLQVPTGTVPFR